MKFEAIIPGPYNARAFEQALRQAADEMGDLLKREFARTTETWQEHDPYFDEIVTRDPDAIGVEVSTEDDIYRFVNDGTRVRYATMTPDFVPKTRVRVIGSFAGRGRMAYVSRQRPRPGIEARHFDRAIAHKHPGTFRRLGELALRRAAHQTGHNYE